VGDYESVDSGVHRPAERALERDDPPLPAGKVPTDPPNEGRATDGERLDPSRDRFRMVGHEAVRRDSDRHLIPYSERRGQERLVTNV
jgi:hypothetical protein